MKLGIFLLAAQFEAGDQGSVLTAAMDAGCAAEEAGFGEAWVAEHHFVPYGLCPSAVTFAAMLLGRTKVLRVGTAISVLPNTHPVLLGEQTALLDQLSGGRFTLGVGRGGPWVDLEVFGTGLDRFGEAGWAESVAVLMRWLTRHRVGADGPRFRFREVPVVPRPLTRPHPPVIVACTSTATAALAARHGLPMLLGMHADDSEKADMVRAYDTAARACGRDPRGVEHAAASVALVADSRTEAVRELRATLPGWLARGLGAHQTVDGRTRPMRDPVAYTDHLCAIHPIGTPADCTAILRRTTEATGIRRHLLFVEGGGTRDRTLDNIRRLGKEVLPRLSDDPGLSGGR
ncbi:LLM class flavin-dependent oxidoreductase [Yinghuangia seranimata]|uniref:LLM class flavin-dependent oxidoreductase n=1 Tax=Yinghuangia seranimata TaxID=408067 RepID=UPI00248AF2B8|nr:LLM class flavin-dependent oxidoreductase [Yinghuangia seranimata]MDI2128219.1 LLM class flavin-dependent oxidoreductase [Yinghuangia seranimata]